MNVAGIDVDSRTLKVVVRRQGKNEKVKVYDNTALGHGDVVALLRRARVQRVCLEATGSYHIDLAVALSDGPDLEVMVLNPKVAKRFAESLGQRQKTDAVDAGVLAEYAERMPFSAWVRPAEEVLALRALTRRVTALTKQRTQAKNHLHAARAARSTPALVLEDMALSIAQLDRQIERLRDAALALVRQHKGLARTLALLSSAKGVGVTSALQLMGELLVLPTGLTARQWVAMAGLDPRHHRSGHSVDKPPRLSKAGNRYLRLALYMPALSACRHEPHVRAYYQHLIVRRGLKKLQAVCAVMRKLLHAFHGMLATQTPFDGTRFTAVRVEPATALA